MLPNPILRIIQDYDLDFYGDSRCRKAIECTDKKEAFRLLLDAADNADHGDACFEVAKAYLWNFGMTTPDFYKAIEYARKGHELKHAMCTNLLTLCHRAGYGTEIEGYEELRVLSTHFHDVDYNSPSSHRYVKSKWCSFFHSAFGDLCYLLNEWFGCELDLSPWRLRMRRLAAAGDPVAFYASDIYEGKVLDAAVSQNNANAVHRKWIRNRNGGYLAQAVALEYPPAMWTYARYLEEDPHRLTPPPANMPTGVTERHQLASSLRQRVEDAGYFPWLLKPISRDR